MMNSTSKHFTRLVPKLALSRRAAAPLPQLSTFYNSTSGMFFSVRPAFLPAIQALIQEVRDKIRSARAAEQFICYLSVPISPRGGGYFEINNEIAAATRAALAARFGKRLMIVDPAAYNLPTMGGESAAGGEYMAVWSDVLAGIDGKGSDLDVVYFSGPVDVARFFGITGEGTIDQFETWMTNRAKNDDAFRDFSANAANHSSFIRYYALRGSAAYSKGAHDEWNIVVAINSKRDIGDEIAIYFNGEPIEPGDYDDFTSIGNQVLGK